MFDFMVLNGHVLYEEEYQDMGIVLVHPCTCRVLFPVCFPVLESVSTI